MSGFMVYRGMFWGEGWMGVWVVVLGSWWECMRFGGEGYRC